MACPNRKPSGVFSLTLLVLVMAAGEPGTAALKLEPAGTSRHFPPLLDCAPAPAAPSNSKNATAFRASVVSLLGALPSAASRSGGAFARGACFGFGATRGRSSSPGDCLSCLSAAARYVAAGCSDASRRAGAWRAGCFLSYADTDRPTDREGAFRGWFYDDSDDGDDGAPTAALGSQCTANRTAAECSRCLNVSALVVPALKGGKQLSKAHGVAVVVVGYACYLRVPLVPPTPQWQEYLFGIVGVFDVVAIVFFEVAGVLFCIKTAREFNPA